MPIERVAQRNAARQSVMKKLAAIVLGLCLLGTIAVHAEDKDKEKEKTKPTAEQKQLRKELMEKYDKNKDGKLDKEERAKVSTEDKEKMKKAGGEHHKKDGEKKKSDK
jgi:hypothetical protein